MAAGATLYKDSGRTQVLDAGTAWSVYGDYGTVDITPATPSASSNVPVYGKNTGTAPLSNILAQAAPAPLSTVATTGTYTAGTNIPVASSANFAVGDTVDIVAAIADPGPSAAFSYPLSPTVRVSSAVVTAVSAGNIQLAVNSGALTSGDMIFTAGELAIIAEIAIAPDASGSAGSFGAAGAEVNIAVGPITAATGTFVFWTKVTPAQNNVEGKFKAAVRLRFTAG